MRLRRLVGNLSTIALVTALLFWFATTLREDVRQELFNLIDIRVYQAGAQAILSGQPLYEPVLGPLYFVYPPFAGLLFLPMAFVGDGLLKGIWLLSSAGLVAWVVTVAAKETRIRRFVTGNTVWKLSIAAAVTIGPVLDTISLGQVNPLILVLVTADLVMIASGRHPRLAGVLIGLAIAIKLTPLVFVVLLVAVRQFRPALVAIATFGLTVALGFLFLPRASMSFWGGAIVDTDRMGHAAILSNQSWSGALARHFDGHAPTGWWLLLAGCSGLLGLAVAVLLYRRDHPLPAAGVLGVAACAASPFSWGHHWVWLLLLVTWGAGMMLHNLVARHRAWLAYAALAVAGEPADHPDDVTTTRLVG